MALWRSGDYFALAMNYSAVANHVVNLTVRVYSLVPVSCLNEHKNKNCISAPQFSGLFGVAERGEAQTSPDRRAALAEQCTRHGMARSMATGDKEELWPL